MIRKRVVLVSLLVAGVALAVLGTLRAQGLFQARHGGSFRVIVRGHNLPFLATFTRNGEVISTVVPLGCLGPRESFSAGHSSWGIFMTKGGPEIRFQLLSDLYRKDEDDPGDPNQTTHVGTMVIQGAAPLPPDGHPVIGTATLRLPGACGGDFPDVRNGVARVEFEARPIFPAGPDDKGEQ